MRNATGLFLLWVCAAFTLTSCIDDFESEGQAKKERNDKELAEYIRNSDVNVHKSPHGFYYQPLTKSGSGIKVNPGNFLSIYYKLTLMDGSVIDSLDPAVDPPLRFRHLTTDLSPMAINLGVSEMEKGDKFRFYIPSYLAYWNLQVENSLPAYSNIIAEISLTDVTDSVGQIRYEKNLIKEYINRHKVDIRNCVELSSGIFYTPVSKGSGKKPAEGEQVIIEYRRKLINEKTIDSGTLTFNVGNNPLEGLNLGVKSMERGDTAVLFIPSHLAYWEQAVLANSQYYSTAKVIPAKFAPEIIIPPYSPLIYEVKLKE